MSWKDLFRGLETEKKQRREEERRKTKEERKREREYRKIVRKFRPRVANVISKFSKSSGCILRESDFEPGTWHDSGYFVPNYSGYKPYAMVRIDPSRGWVRVFFDQAGGIEFVPLSTFTEEALAKALVKAYKGECYK